MGNENIFRRVKVILCCRHAGDRESPPFVTRFYRVAALSSPVVLLPANAV